MVIMGQFSSVSSLRHMHLPMNKFLLTQTDKLGIEPKLLTAFVMMMNGKKIVLRDVESGEDVAKYGTMTAQALVVAQAALPVVAPQLDHDQEGEVQ